MGRKGFLKFFASDAHIVYNHYIARAFGIYEALVLGVLISADDYFDNRDMETDGFFYCTVDYMYNKTALTEYQQRSAINNLEKQGFIETKRKGIPAKRYFKINYDLIEDTLLNKMG